MRFAVLLTLVTVYCFARPQALTDADIVAIDQATGLDLTSVLDQFNAAVDGAGAQDVVGSGIPAAVDLAATTMDPAAVDPATTTAMDPVILGTMDTALASAADAPAGPGDPATVGAADAAATVDPNALPDGVLGQVMMASVSGVTQDPTVGVLPNISMKRRR
ncbi:hypothetical protein BC830DRAFT_1107012 [Chytriomyces sp. MP71]|nr:hypothetical protein BC830DRAFT_1107012 [Chytriomyces sp. MP71]